jgi:Acetyltransferases, including N-acetylases of ribosomal proteins
MMNIADIFSDLPVLETDRLLLRKLRMEDEQDLFEYCSDEHVSKYTVWYSHRTLDDTRMYLDAVMGKYNRHEVAPWGVEEKESGKLIGTTGFVHWDTKHARAELGYALSRSCWNKGYMTEAVRAVIAFGFEQMGVVRIEARCHLENWGSAKVMEKSGLLFEGILRKQIFVKQNHEDVKLYAITIDDYNRSRGGAI